MGLILLHIHDYATLFCFFHALIRRGKSSQRGSFSSRIGISALGIAADQNLCEVHPMKFSVGPAALSYRLIDRDWLWGYDVVIVGSSPDRSAGSSTILHVVQSRL